MGSVKKKVINFGKSPDIIDIPNLLDNQKESYEQFLAKGIGEIFNSCFPITDYSGDLEMEFVSYKIGQSDITPEESKKRNKNYSAPLKGTFRLHKKKIKHVIESEVFLGDVPLMTDKGSFVIAGNERVVVTQIVRSPGVYFEEEITKKGEVLQKARIIPSIGAWCYFMVDRKGVLLCSIDHKGKKFPATVLLKVLGLGDNNAILELFEHHPTIVKTLEKDTTETEEEAVEELFRKWRQNEGFVYDKAKRQIEELFFDPKRYDLAPWGRLKLNEKLHVAERLHGRVLGMPAGGHGVGEVLTEDEAKNLTTNVAFVDTKAENLVKVIGNEQPTTHTLTANDFVAIISYMLNLGQGVGSIDNIDHLSNRRFRLAGELVSNQFRIGAKRLEKYIREKMSTAQSASFNKGKDDDEEKVLAGLTPQMLINIRPIVATLKEFFGSSPLAQFVDQINPLSELTNKRRTSALGPGGFMKERAGMEVRDVHYSHYGNICPVETPEGFGVGLIGTTTLFSRINEYGFIETPYMRVDKKKKRASKDDIVYLMPGVSEKYRIAQRSEVDNEGNFVSKNVLVRHGKDYEEVKPEEVDYVDVSTKQLVGGGAALIPCLENDDANRALMGANMQRQAVSQIAPQEPFIGTGIEGRVATDTGTSYVAEEDGKVVRVDNEKVVVSYKNGEEKSYNIYRMMRTNGDTSFNHRVKVYPGQVVKKGDVLVDSYSSNNGELALGQNLLVAFTPAKGYNFEDAIVLNQRLLKEDAFTTIMLTQYKIERRETKLGNEEFTIELPEVSVKSTLHLDEEGIVKLGTLVRGDEILVGKATPKTQEELNPHERLLTMIFDKKTNDVKNNSLLMEHAKQGIVVDITRNNVENAQLNKGVIEEVVITIAEKRKITEGDKMAGRHGNKGIVAKILPEEDMPFLEDGTPVDVLLNPLGVPSRMNLGQIMETHLGMVAKLLGIKYTTPVFDGPSEEEIFDELESAGLPVSGKFYLHDGITGQRYENPVSVGVMYMLKLSHQVEDKLHARATGPYSLITQQPLGGKAQMGGQRFGEMEVWALEGHGAAYTLQELMTYKSDDLDGRNKVYEAIAKGSHFPEPNVGEAFPVLLNEMRGLGLNVEAIRENGENIMKSNPKMKEEDVRE